MIKLDYTLLSLYNSLCACRSCRLGFVQLSKILLSLFPRSARCSGCKLGETEVKRHLSLPSLLFILVTCTAFTRFYSFPFFRFALIMLTSLALQLQPLQSSCSNPGSAAAAALSDEDQSDVEEAAPVEVSSDSEDSSAVSSSDSDSDQSEQALEGEMSAKQVDPLEPDAGDAASKAAGTILFYFVSADIYLVIYLSVPKSAQYSMFFYQRKESANKLLFWQRSSGAIGLLIRDQPANCAHWLRFLPDYFLHFAISSFISAFKCLLLLGSVLRRVTQICQEFLAGSSSSESVASKGPSDLQQAQLQSLLQLALLLLHVSSLGQGIATID